jgi:peroxisomal membrane protein 4
MLSKRCDIIIVLLHTMSNLQQEIYSLLKGLRNGV